MKRFACIALAAMLLLAGCAKSETTYVRKQHDGVSYSVPENWKEEATDLGRYYYVRGDSNAYLYVYSQRTVRNIESALVVEITLRDIADGLVEGLEDGQITHGEIGEQSGLPAYTVGYTAKIQGVDVVAQSTLILTGEKVFGFTFLAQGALPDAMVEHMDAVLNSIEFDEVVG